MNDRQRLEAIISVVCKYLPPDGTPINEAMSEIISYVDPLPPLPVQEPVACRFCHDKRGSWAWQCYNCGEIDDVQHLGSSTHD